MVKRNQFPVILGYAITIHNLQGGTLQGWLK